jgi:N-acetylmuramoyl-L-alanine amidase
MNMPKTKTTGKDILSLARKHLGEKYVLGVSVPKNNNQWKGPWDCAEFVSWMVYQTSAILYGCCTSNGNPATADAYTGYWNDDAKTRGIKISVEEAARTQGAAILRIPQTGSYGHIVLSNGKGGTIEAHSTLRGVIDDTLAGRRWDTGILIPGIEYKQLTADIEVEKPSTIIYRLTKPQMVGLAVKVIQRALKDAGYNAGGIDGVFGPMTHAAVVAFQITNGLIPDGEVGPKTAKVLGMQLA